MGGLGLVSNFSIFVIRIIKVLIFRNHPILLIPIIIFMIFTYLHSTISYMTILPAGIGGSESSEDEREGRIRVGRDYQAVPPPYIPSR